MDSKQNNKIAKAKKKRQIACCAYWSGPFCLLRTCIWQRNRVQIKLYIRLVFGNSMVIKTDIVDQWYYCGPHGDLDDDLSLSLLMILYRVVALFLLYFGFLFFIGADINVRGSWFFHLLLFESQHMDWICCWKATYVIIGIWGIFSTWR